MKNILFIAGLLIATFSFAQTDVEDQNPNHQQSRDYYMNNNQNYVAQQGTTVDNTYDAIDELEAKRKRKELRKEIRTLKPLLRHQRKMERIKNRPRYYNYGYNRPYYNHRNYRFPRYNGVRIGSPFNSNFYCN